MAKRSRGNDDENQGGRKSKGYFGSFFSFFGYSNNDDDEEKVTDLESTEGRTTTVERKNMKNNTHTPVL